MVNGYTFMVVGVVGGGWEGGTQPDSFSPLSQWKSTPIGKNVFS